MDPLMESGPSRRHSRRVSYRAKNGERQFRTEEYSTTSATEALKAGLERKLSTRATVQDLMDRKILIRFNDAVAVEHVDTYDRRSAATTKRKEEEEEEDEEKKTKKKKNEWLIRKKLKLRIVRYEVNT